MPKVVESRCVAAAGIPRLVRKNRRSELDNLAEAWRNVLKRAGN